MYSAAALLAGVLLVWGCANGNTGSEGSPCVSDGECAEGLLCVHAKCSSGLRGSLCGNDDDCVNSLICRSNGACGGLVGDECFVGDRDCVEGVLCIPTEPDNDDVLICALAGSRQIGDACRVHGHCRSLACVGNLCVGSGTVWTSRTIRTSSTVSSTVSRSLRDIHYGDGLWVAAGAGSRTDDMGTTIRTGEIVTSANGETWSAQSISAAHFLQDIHYGNSRWVAVGTTVDEFSRPSGGVIITSTDGSIWMEQTNHGVNGSLTSIHYAAGANDDKGRWAAGGRLIDNTLATSAFAVTTSLNGTTWTRRTAEDAQPPVTLHDIHYANNLWVAVGGGSREDGAVITGADSTDGITGTDSTVWMSQPNNARDQLYNVHYADGLWVAVEENGAIITSKDGITWTARTSNVSGGLRDVYYANNVWVAVGSDTDSMMNDVGGITTSTDGIDWIARTSNVSGRLLDIHYANNVWVGVGNNGVITTSADGITWTAQTSKVSANLRAVHYNNNLWVAVGEDGTITTAP